MRRVLVYLIWSVVSLLISCNVQPTTGTEIENERFTARIVNPDGTGATNATVTLLPVTFIPNSEVMAKKLLTTFSQTTDDEGYFDVRDLEEGCYNVYSVKGGLAAFYDSVYVTESGIGRKKFALDKTSSIRGVVTVQPNHDPRIVEVQILGTHFYSPVDSSGYFEFSEIAAGEYHLRCVANREGYSIAYPTVQADGDLGDTVAITLDYLDIPIVEGVQALFNTDRYVILVSWNKSNYPDLYEYVIFRDVDGSVEPSMTPIAVTSDTFFIDAVSSRDVVEGGYTYRYRIAIRDNGMELGPTYGFCTVTVPENEFYAMISTDTSYAQVGDTVTVYLNVISSYSPISEINWFFNNYDSLGITFPTDDSIMEYADTVSITITDSTEATFFCEVINSMGMHIIDTVSITIERFEDTTATDTLVGSVNVDTISGAIGDTVTIVVDVFSSSSPLTEIVWVPDILTSNYLPEDSLYTYSDTLDLVITDLLPNIVYCQISNSSGTRLIDSLIVNIIE